MPTYEYACTECGHTFEQVQSFYDDALTHCPQCDGRLRKVFNAVGVVFKGSGFYHTDNRAAASSGSSGSKEAASTSDSGSGEKAAAPSGTKSAAGSGSGSSGGDSSRGSKATTSSSG